MIDCTDNHPGGSLADQLRDLEHNDTIAHFTNGLLHRAADRIDELEQLGRNVQRAFMPTYNVLGIAPPEMARAWHDEMERLHRESLERNDVLELAKRLMDEDRDGIERPSVLVEDAIERLHVTNEDGSTVATVTPLNVHPWPPEEAE